MIARRTCTTPEDLIKKINTKSNTNSNVTVKNNHVADTWDHNEGHT